MFIETGKNGTGRFVNVKRLHEKIRRRRRKQKKNTPRPLQRLRWKNNMENGTQFYMTPYKVIIN